MPDLVVATVPGERSRQDRLRQREARRVQPQFGSLRYGTPEYCRLTLGCAEEIRQGADDRSEMGVFHDVFEPQRQTNLDVRLSEYVPAAVEVGIYYAS